jgi:hypothetical protein
VWRHKPHSNGCEIQIPLKVNCSVIPVVIPKAAWGLAQTLSDSSLMIIENTSNAQDLWASLTVFLVDRANPRKTRSKRFIHTSTLTFKRCSSYNTTCHHCALGHPCANVMPANCSPLGHSCAVIRGRRCAWGYSRAKVTESRGQFNAISHACTKWENTRKFGQDFRNLNTRSKHILPNTSLECCLYYNLLCQDFVMNINSS